MATRRQFLISALTVAALPGIARAADRMPAASPIAFAKWTDDEPFYLLYPGDKLEVSVPGAPELSRQTQVGPDGRIILPLIGPVMAAYKSVPQLQDELQDAYAGILRYPQIMVFPGDTAPMRVLVGGEVRNPGWVDMLADMDALQATIAAGGFTNGARAHNVMIIRRGREGQAMLQVVDLKDPLKGKAGRMTALRRFDIVYVPRTAVAEAGVFMEQWVNNLIPAGIMNYFTYKTFGSN